MSWQNGVDGFQFYDNIADHDIYLVRFFQFVILIKTGYLFFWDAFNATFIKFKA